ncbi:hypothetical protein AVEN_118767-1 [Araneus ventricosus]|uniref:Uncharacterized protein n=1 Tax=Araneus ventricosus TaxID=182803 RepID=A0A4Y2BXD3_ARAVE|nr:hypothetical protein AVEN_118767-1 [Araneus ventricosus]
MSVKIFAMRIQSACSSSRHLLSVSPISARQMFTGLINSRSERVVKRQLEALAKGKRRGKRRYPWRKKEFRGFGSSSAGFCHFAKLATKDLLWNSR